jgi:hypothetical protein
VDRACAGIHSDEIGRQDNGGAREERMLRSNPFDFVPLECLQWFSDCRPASRRAKFFDERFREQERLGATLLLEFAHCINLFGSHRDRQVRG